ncbi:MAG: nucleotidyltransferase domain-containing protein [Methanophagales archaeon]|nr:nucleotidyltransferase domain-containing protein [Methanophagales archaeon]
MDKNFQEIFNSIKNQKAFLKDRYKVKEIGVFGSFVKGEQKRGSDVDILVVFENEMELGGFEYIGLMNDLEDYLMKIWKRV